MKRKESKGLGRVVISFVLSIVMFIGLLSIEKSMLSPNGKIKVVVAKQDIDGGTSIENLDVDSLFEVVEVDGSLKFSSVITNLEDLKGKTVDSPISKGEIVSSNRLADGVLANIKDKVEVSIKAPDLSQVVGGILREGDLININMVNSTTLENEVVLEGAYVSRVFSSAGVEIGRESKEPALALNVIVSKDDSVKINTAGELGTIKVAKVK